MPQASLLSFCSHSWNNHMFCWPLAKACLTYIKVFPSSFWPVHWPCFSLGSCSRTPAPQNVSGPASTRVASFVLRSTCFMRLFCLNFSKHPLDMTFLCFSFHLLLGAVLSLSPVRFISAGFVVCSILLAASWLLHSSAFWCWKYCSLHEPQ